MSPKVKISEEQFQQYESDYVGFCTECQSFNTGGVEPDAQNYPCEECDTNSVQGTLEVLLDGLVEIVE